MLKRFLLELELVFVINMWLEPWFYDGVHAFEVDGSMIDIIVYLITTQY